MFTIAYIVMTNMTICGTIQFNGHCMPIRTSTITRALNCQPMMIKFNLITFICVPRVEWRVLHVSMLLFTKYISMCITLFTCESIQRTFNSTITAHCRFLYFSVLYIRQLRGHLSHLMAFLDSIVILIISSVFIDTANQQRHFLSDLNGIKDKPRISFASSFSPIPS